MRKRDWGWPLLLVFGSFLILIWANSMRERLPPGAGESMQSSGMVTPERAERAADAPTAGANGRGGGTPEPSKAEEARDGNHRPRPRVAELLPRTEDVRREIEQDPHGTPPSVLRFATRVAGRMEEAKGGESKARQLLRELGECVHQESAVLSSRALCLSNAERLSRLHPRLKRDYEVMRDEAPNEVRRLVQHLNSLAS